MIISNSKIITNVENIHAPSIYSDSLPIFMGASLPQSDSLNRPQFNLHIFIGLDQKLNIDSKRSRSSTNIVFER